MIFEREDWKLFRNMETLPQKAGVPKSKLSMLVCKELVDNALDICGDCEIGYESDFFYVKDRGPGLDPELFSINRPLRSSKYLRLPTRGALGNGLRVIAGAVVASGGELYVSTRGKNYKINFQNDGTALPESLGDYHEEGTKIRFTLGKMPINSSWAQKAIEYAKGETYRGKTSPYWYTSENFFELFQSFSGSVRELIAQFDGCTGKVIPPENIMQESLEHSLHDKLGQKIAAEILEQNHYADQVAEEVRQVKQCCLDSQTRLAETVQAELKKEPVNRWKDVVETLSEEMIKNCRF